MTKPGWTKGPWKAIDRSKYNMSVGDAKWEISQMSGEEQFWVALAISEANANLIAAAPDLYAVLSALWEAVKRYDRIGYEGSELLEVMSDAQAALAKARGEA